MGLITMSELAGMGWGPGDLLPKTEASGAYSARGRGMSSTARLVRDVEAAMGDPRQEAYAILQHGAEAERLIALRRKSYPGAPVVDILQYRARVRGERSYPGVPVRSLEEYQARVRLRDRRRGGQQQVWTDRDYFRARSARMAVEAARAHRRGVPAGTFTREYWRSRAAADPGIAVALQRRRAESAPRVEVARGAALAPRGRDLTLRQAVALQSLPRPLVASGMKGV